MALHHSALEFLASKYDNVVKYDADGNPSIFVRFPKMKSSELFPSLPNHTHPAFIVNGVEQDEILLGKFKAAEVAQDGALYSLPNVPPRTGLGADELLERMRAAHTGASGMTVADRGFLLLLAAKNGWFQKGNNSESVDYRDGTPWKPAEAVTADTTKRVLHGWEYLCRVSHTTSSLLRPDLAPAYWERKKFIGGVTVPSQRAQPILRGRNTLNGSGPNTWYLGGTAGMADVVGNCAEYDYGYRLVNCELQILPNNDAANPSADLSASSAAWRAILPNATNDGYALVAPGTTGTLKWKKTNTGMQLDLQTVYGEEGSMSIPFKDLFDSYNSDRIYYVPHILKELGLFPTYQNNQSIQGYVTVDFSMQEQLFVRGGNYYNTNKAGLGCVNKADRLQASTRSAESARPRCMA